MCQPRVAVRFPSDAGGAFQRTDPPPPTPVTKGRRRAAWAASSIGWGGRGRDRVELRVATALAPIRPRGAGGDGNGAGIRDLIILTHNGKRCVPGSATACEIRRDRPSARSDARTHFAKEDGRCVDDHLR